MSEWYVARDKPGTKAHLLGPVLARWVPKGDFRPDRWLMAECGPTYLASKVEPAPADRPRCKKCGRLMKEKP